MITQYIGKKFKLRIHEFWTKNSDDESDIL